MDQLLQLLIHYKYILIIPLTLIEGPVVMMMCGFLIKIGVMELAPAYFLLMLGDLIGDVFWYSVGYFFGMPFVKKFGKYVNVTEKNIHVIERVFHRFQNSILFLSKITMGFGFALVTLITAGLVKIPFRRYFLFNFFGEFFWTGALILLGYAFGKVYTTFNSVLGTISTIALFIITFACLVGFGKFIRREVLKKYQ